MSNRFTVVDQSTNKILLEIDQGSDYIRTLTFYEDAENTIPKDITGYLFSGKARYENHYSETVAEFTTDVTDATNGIMRWSIPNATTAAMKSGDWVWDLEMQDSAGLITRIMHGDLELSPEATY